MNSPASSGVQYNVTDHVATISLVRPDKMNSLTRAAKQDLRDYLHQAASDSQVRCVVIAGSGRAFCVGQDLDEHLATAKPDGSMGDPTTVAEHYNPIVTAIATMPKPVIAAVNGIAAGAGASIAFAADFRILGQSAGFNTAFAAIGFSCDTGASWTLPRLVGHANALDLLMRPRTIDAAYADKIGLATSVVADDQLDQAVAELARELAAGPTLAYGAIKRSLTFASTNDLASSLEFEGRMMALTAASVDHRMAVSAFLDKRPPVFEGR